MRIEKTQIAETHPVHLVGALEVYGGVGIDKNLIVGSTDDSTAINSGAVVILGGASIAKNLYLGGSIYSPQTQTIINIPTDKWYCVFYTTTSWGINALSISISSPDGSLLTMHINGSIISSELINNSAYTGEIVLYNTYTTSGTLGNTSVLATSELASINYILQTFVATASATCITFSLYKPRTDNISGLILPINIYQGIDNTGTLLYSGSITVPNDPPTAWIDYIMYGNLQIISGTTYTIELLVGGVSNQTYVMTSTSGSGTLTIDGIVQTNKLNYSIAFGTVELGKQIMVKRNITGTKYSINSSVVITSLQQINLNYTTLQLGTIQYSTSTDTNKKVYLNENLYVSGITNITSTETSTSTSIGSLIVAGGVGIAKQLYVGGNTEITGTFNSGSGIITTLSITDTTESISTSMGSLIVAGGVGIGKGISFPNIGGSGNVLSYNIHNSTTLTWTYTGDVGTESGTLYYSQIGNSSQSTITLDFLGISHLTSSTGHFETTIPTTLKPKQSKYGFVKVIIDGTTIQIGSFFIDTATGQMIIYGTVSDGDFSATTSSEFKSFSLSYIA